MAALSVVLGLLAVVLLLPTASDVVSRARIALRRERQRPASSHETPRLLFLVPAHNEQLLIESCVRSILRIRYPTTHYGVVVVADNCTDRTAALAGPPARDAWSETTLLDRESPRPSRGRCNSPPS